MPSWALFGPGDVVFIRLEVADNKKRGRNIVEPFWHFGRGRSRSRSRIRGRSRSRSRSRMSRVELSWVPGGIAPMKIYTHWFICDSVAIMLFEYI